MPPHWQWARPTPRFSFSPCRPCARYIHQSSRRPRRSLHSPAYHTHTSTAELSYIKSLSSLPVSAHAPRRHLSGGAWDPISLHALTHIQCRLAHRIAQTGSTPLSLSLGSLVLLPSASASGDVERVARLCILDERWEVDDRLVAAVRARYRVHAVVGQVARRQVGHVV